MASLERKYNCIEALTNAGITYSDAVELRRISMTLHRWHELECGDSNDYASWTIVRGFHDRKACIFSYFDEGKPYVERHVHTENKARYEPIADRERGALKRLEKIMARYPGWQSYVQGDPRGASLYILRPGDLPEVHPDSGPDYRQQQINSLYNRGIAVCK